jgi:hypothetical protein
MHIVTLHMNAAAFDLIWWHGQRLFGELGWSIVSIVPLPARPVWLLVTS